MSTRTGWPLSVACFERLVAGHVVGGLGAELVGRVHQRRPRDQPELDGHAAGISFITSAILTSWPAACSTAVSEAAEQVE